MSNYQMTPVKSSNIASVGYDADNGDLYVRFSNGSTYKYFNVPEETYQALLGDPSPGGYFSDNIKGSYTYSRA